MLSKMSYPKKRELKEKTKIFRKSLFSEEVVERSSFRLDAHWVVRGNRTTELIHDGKGPFPRFLPSENKNRLTSNAYWK